MLVFQKVADLQLWLAQRRHAGSHIGFTPTMGALHDGHLDLVRRAALECDYSVASIFVNPTQFNDPKDLEKYPRTPGRDLELLQQAGCHAVFMPPVEEVYPPGFDITVRLDFGPTAQVMEGYFRPGHFNGMATVVKRLLDIVQPLRLYMGQKDFQQVAIVRAMLHLLGAPIELIMCDTRRESDGLAMSSRNVRLTPEMRALAPEIFHTLSAAKEQFDAGTPIEQIERKATERLSLAGFFTEYFHIVDGVTLQSASPATPYVVACTALWAGEVRLIDNLVFRK